MIDAAILAHSLVLLCPIETMLFILLASSLFFQTNFLHTIGTNNRTNCLLFVNLPPWPCFIWNYSEKNRSWLRLLKLKRPRQRPISLKLRFPFMTPFFCTAVSDGFALTVFSYNTNEMLSCRLLVKHMKICRHSTNICCSRWLRGTTIISRYVFLVIVNATLLWPSPFFLLRLLECLGYCVGFFTTSLWDLSHHIANFMQLVSESVKAKQLHSALLSEKQALADQLKQINSLIENSKKKIASSVEQVLFPLLPSPTYIFYFWYFSKQLCCCLLL